jgi:hypothetical protein
MTGIMAIGPVASGIQADAILNGFIGKGPFNTLRANVM